MRGQGPEVVGGDEPPVGDHGDAPHPEAGLRVLQHGGQGRDVRGVAGEHVMRDRDPIGGAQQPDHFLPIGVVQVRALQAIPHPLNPPNSGRGEGDDGEL